MTDIISALEKSREELLDLSTRNRLISTPRSSKQSSRLEVIDELSAQVFRHLVTECKSMTFLPTKDGNESGEDALLLQPDEEETSGDVSSRHADSKLQTALDSEKLQRKLLKLAYDARTFEEEQGVNTLYLALGFLKWFEDDKPDRERFGPLLLIPVTLERQSAAAKFKIAYTEDDIATNLSLQARLQRDFGIKLPDVPDVEDLDPSDYFAQVASAVEGQATWQVLPDDMVLWFYSFSKFLMYRDLDAENWPEGEGLKEHSLIQAMMGDGFQGDPPLCDDGESIDPVIRPIDMVHVMDADSSQAIVIEEAKKGRNLVIQGPPGTGKSQTITNVIAAAVKAGKRVLFVAEKMAALDVVDRRLTNVGLGDLSLELHSHKANKKSVLQELERTLKRRRPKVEDVSRHCDQLEECRDRLNAHLNVIHAPLEPSGFTPYQMIGELVRLRANSTDPPNFDLPEALNWSRDDFRSRLNLLRSLAQLVDTLGVPGESPWRGVELDVVLPTDVARLEPKFETIATHLTSLIATGQRLANMLGVSAPDSVRDVWRLAVTAQLIGAAPPMDRYSLANPAWVQQRQQIDSVVGVGKQFNTLRAQLSEQLVDAAWDTDVTAARRDLAAHGRSWLRFLNGSYRAAKATLRGIASDDLPTDVGDQVGILDQLMNAQKARAALSEGSGATVGAAAFGSYWHGPDSDWDSLTAITSWEQKCRDSKVDPRFRKIMARLSDVPDFKPILQQFSQDLTPLKNELGPLQQALKFNVQEAFGAADLFSVSMADLKRRIEQWQESTAELSLWVNYFNLRRNLESLGLAALAAELHSGTTLAEDAVPKCEMAFHEELIRSVFKLHPELAGFHGATHEHVLEKFRELDMTRIDIARHEVGLAHYEQLPKSGAGVGEVGIVHHEIQKKRRHFPIRKLLSRAGRAVQAIKPVFMMSPLSVAQYLEPGAIEFDLLLIDEASQVQPVDALGAVARAKQIVVVGDTKQLPPTTFFQRMAGEGDQESEDDEKFHTGDLESILGLCLARSVPERLLSWHYRSRHHSLITVSNHEFYDDRLFVVPSPGEPGPGQGLTFHYVAEGVFDRGKSATNRNEARVVAEAAMTHARETPKKTLGIGTFSVKQRDAILDELELLRRANPSLEHFFSSGVAEPFFVKNLENIQGDERDVIFISVGYGKDESGYMAMNFGPLSNDGGERRLNVLISRARECCTVFSSIVAEDIDLTRAKAKGAAAFKTFLKYAETGLLDTGVIGEGEHESEFERQVAKALADLGVETRPQVGVAGFRVDLAVVDPEQPGRFLLGVECDGASYHRSRSVRDRDRLRQAVLEDRGWIIHRIWSTDWFHRPEEELRKVMAAIESAKIKWAARDTAGDTEKDTPPVVERVELAREEDDLDISSGAPAVTAEPYVVASFRIKSNDEIHELDPTQLARVVGKIIEVEGPIHSDEVARRVTQLWGLQRTGKRIRDSVQEAVEIGSRERRWAADGPFLYPRSLTDPVIRDRSAVDCTTLKKPEMLPPVEIRKALIAVVDTHLGVEPGDAVVETARLLGFRSVRAQVRGVVEEQLRALIESGRLDERNGKLYLAIDTSGTAG